MTIHPSLRTAALLLCLSLPAGAADIPLPEGTRPFDQPIPLRYGGFERFTHTFRTDIRTPTGLRLAEGWVMEGTMRPAGDSLEWSYRLSNIGHDGNARERGSLSVRTDRWGAVQSARVIEDRWAQLGQPRGGADAMFDAQNLLFPLCCCPREAVRMGEALAMAPNTATMPVAPPDAANVVPGPDGPAVTLRKTVRTTAAGLFEAGGRRFLVLRHEGGGSAETGDERVTVRLGGLSLIDIRTCQPAESAWLNEFEFTNGSAAPVFGLLHRSETR